MKYLFSAIFTLILLFPLFSMAETEYKCHVSLSNAEQFIITRNDKTPEFAESALKDTFIRVNQRRLRINHVFECIPMQYRFKDEKARRLEKNLRF